MINLFFHVKKKNLTNCDGLDGVYTINSMVKQRKNGHKIKEQIIMLENKYEKIFFNTLYFNQKRFLRENEINRKLFSIDNLNTIFEFQAEN